MCPVDPDARVWLLSPHRAIDCLIVGHEIHADALGSSRLVSLPGLSITVGEMVAALERVAGADVVARIKWERDPKVVKVVATWPGALDTTRARSLGFPGDSSFDDIVRRYIEDER